MSKKVKRLTEGERVQRCVDKIRAACQKYECSLVGIPSFTPDGRVAVVIQTVPNPVEAEKSES